MKLPLSREEMQELRSCSCSIPCIVYCNVVLVRIKKQQEEE